MSVSAFSNTRGGVVLLGLDERAGFIPAPGFDARRVRDQVVTGLAEKLDPRPIAEIELNEVDGAQIVTIDVEELPSYDKPCFVVSKGKERGSYERRADGDHRMGTYQVFLHSINVQQPEDDLQAVDGAGLSDLDPMLVRRMLARLRQAGRRAVADVDSEADALRRLNVLARHRDEPVPTVAGLLALGRYPQEFFPQWMVSFAVYPGATKDAVDEELRMDDQRTIDGPIPVMVERAVEAVVRNLRMAVHSRGVGAESVPEIPVDVLREAMANALTHRDYSSFVRGEQVRVELYPDRVEIQNAGGIWGGRTERELLDGVSRSRNAMLALLLQDVPFPDRDEVVCENKGSGIPRMTGLMRRRGLAIPRFQDRTTTFTVTLDRHGLVDPPTREWLALIGADGLAPRSQCALAMVRRAEFVDDQVLRHQLAIDTRDAQALLSELVSEGWLVNPGRRGDTFGQGPRLTEAPALLPRPESRPSRTYRSRIDGLVLDALDVDEPRTVHDIVRTTGLAMSAIRRRLTVLVDQGQVHATAPPTSHHRAYRRAPGG